MAALPKLTDEEARYLTRDELLRRYRDLECGYLRVASDRGSMMKDLNQRMQIHLTEIRGLKDVNQRLQDDNQELRDLCCFLDDDRRKAMKLAREWQRFGRYTSSVMRSELAAYQHKLQELEKQQEGLVRDNFELKELCLFLDRERETDPSSAGRAEGDGTPTLGEWRKSSRQ
ncbi:hypothetical protein CAPTEDRAFT_196142 [Capitella teleta]|uniref:Coiled-coil domain-containing protein 85C n=1 Tax=Capitella teleta TaxID=283909 RepID=R7U8L7_CAPTE|nr:hypothetical protein CAPTEDRAFT_196142 [Capitella teleta]|eukprot:ELT99455.1 hypothetical protein CAPTEDRAFT_196142 [Capitella teleta]